MKIGDDVRIYLVDTQAAKIEGTLSEINNIYIILDDKTVIPFTSISLLFITKSF